MKLESYLWPGSKIWSNEAQPFVLWNEWVTALLWHGRAQPKRKYKGPNLITTVEVHDGWAVIILRNGPERNSSVTLFYGMEQVRMHT